MQDRIIALNLHGIGTPARQLEPGEAPYWITEAQYDALLDRVAAAPHRDRIRLTFDDGNASDILIGLPGLRARGLDAAFFVLTDRIGTEGSLSESDIRDLLAAGQRIGSHGAAHRDWSALGREALAAEIDPPLARLSDIAGHPVTSVAIPFGRWSGAVLRALRQAGVRTAWTSDGGPAREGAFLRPRTSLRGDMSLGDLDRLVAGDFPPARHLRRMAGMARKWAFGPG